LFGPWSATAHKYTSKSSEGEQITSRAMHSTKLLGKKTAGFATTGAVFVSLMGVNP
jgi:hypothetical protein